VGIMDVQGLLTICSLENTATAGHKPEEKLVVIETAYYEERTAGITRIYQASGADRRFDLLVRCFNTEVPREGLYVVIDTEQYRIDLCQKIIGHDAVDLTLVKVENYYDVISF
jgi:hypothetical protein